MTKDFRNYWYYGSTALVTDPSVVSAASVVSPATVVPTFVETVAEDNDEVVSENVVNQEAQEQLLICVRDCGAGVAEDQLERIMQPFERGETARTTQGSGLGLAIVDRIARLHHGTVEAINHPDGGLQVCVRIPLLSKVAGDTTLAAETTEGAVTNAVEP